MNVEEKPSPRGAEDEETGEGVPRPASPTPSKVRVPAVATPDANPIDPRVGTR